MLTNKQRNYLRKLSHGLDAIYQVGKNGLGENTIKQFFDGLEARELVKASVLNNSLFDAREAAETIADSTGAEVVSVIGNKFVLYKESRKKKTIELPKA
ncbi:MAG TPA: ribosome assembly RNA-binding protein YhbY [Clostridia bacterium]|nr:ribosome assembly RNA-binding protein YhbY [Clostridia bacterium]HPQ47745.1 ribosome assembly RNA-binding protein YhbY [Clostridia bacterium]HRX41522.1 ribosome assembly RNA-binding protein YhbY [Clostridia bacterium]